MGALPPRVLATCARLNRTPSRQASRGLLLAMAALMLCMPMSYRAGTDFSHPHAFFQPFIDAATGHSHHDADELVAGSQPDQGGAFSPFVPPDVPLRQPTDDTGVHYRVVNGHILYTVPASARTPDTPSLTSLTAPLEQASGIPALSLIILLLFAAVWRHAVWVSARPPRGIAAAPEPPPPRLRVA